MADRLPRHGVIITDCHANLPADQAGGRGRSMPGMRQECGARGGACRSKNDSIQPGTEWLQRHRLGAPQSGPVAYERYSYSFHLILRNYS